MAVVTAPPPVFTTLLTAADLALFPDELPSGAVKYELIDGRLIVMAPPGDIHGAAQSNVATELKIQGERRGHGKCRTEVGIQLSQSPDTVVGADAVFITNARLPLVLTKEGWHKTIADLVVEVRSKNDTRPQVQDKVDRYFAAGVRVVWVPDPIRQEFTVYRPGQNPQVLLPSDTVTIDDVIPGFQALVSVLLQE